MLDLRLLTHAIALADHGSFARAARAIHLSQPALSRSIQTLETQMGVVLFERGKRGVHPTEAGFLVLNRARVLALQSEDLEKEIGSLGKGTPEGLRVACGPYPGRLLAGKALARCLVRNPGFRASVFVDSYPKVIQMVMEREAEFGICETSDMRHAELETLPLRRRQGHAVARDGHPLAGQSPLAINDLMGFPLVFTTRLPPRILRNLLPQDGRQPLPSIRCESLQVALDVIRHSDAIAFFPETMVRGDSGTPPVVPLDFAPDWLHTAFHLVWLRGRPLPEDAALFRDALLAVDAGLE